MPAGEAQGGRNKPGRGFRSWLLRPHSPTNITFQAELLYVEKVLVTVFWYWEWEVAGFGWIGLLG